jgi:enoyl-CoA hydratase/carnithine racemase
MRPSSQPAELVRSEVCDGVATITLNDVARRNSVTPELSRALEAACHQLAADADVRVVVLASAAPAFSAGGDIGSLTNPVAPLAVMYRGFEALAGLTVPTLAAVNGPAVGAGMNFVLACDLIIAAESARFDPRFLDIGIHPGGGHLWRLQARVGRQATAALVLFGESLSGSAAVGHGLAWACVPDDELMTKAHALARRVAGRSTELVRRTKATLNASGPITNGRDAADLERVAQEWSMSRPAFRAGVAALERSMQERRAATR